MNFDDWKSGFLIKAQAEGVSDETLSRIAPFLKTDTAPTKADAGQAEARKTLRQYLNLVVSEKRIAEGIAALSAEQTIFDAIEHSYSVDRHIVAAIWGMESNYGAIRGDIPVFTALASLAHSGRRQALFENQLIAACKIVERGTIAPENMLGSWAGAMGHTQFMPSSYLDFAVSAEQAQPNIWSDDPADALFSTAHYLICHGWDPELVWGGQATYRSEADLHFARHSEPMSLVLWSSSGITADLKNGKYRFVLPAGVQAPAFLTSQNFDAILKYNNATAYAVAVGHLADRLRGGDALSMPDGEDVPALSQPHLKELQDRLTALGYDTQGADGYFGPNTEIAIDGYQAAHNLPVDGYPNLILLEHVKSMS